MKKLIALVLLAVLVAGGWYLASPWLALKGLRDAAMERDVAELERRVDFPAMRQSVRREVGQALRDRAAEGGPLHVLAARAAEQFGGVALDQVVSPRGVAGMIATGAIAAPLIPERLRGQDIAWDVSRAGIDSFRAVGTFEDGTPGPALIFRRDGLGWTLVGIELP